MAQPVLSIQLASLKSLGGLEAQLDAASRAGYETIELIEEQIADPRALRANLDVRGLTAASVHISLSSLRDHPGEIVAGARMAGASRLVVTSAPRPDDEIAIEGWRALGREMGGLAARLTDTGLSLGYHNHDWELATLKDGSRPLDLLLAEGEEGGLGWQADPGWLARAGEEPAAWLRRYTGRVTSVHVNDVAPEWRSGSEGGWTDIGRGTVDWPDLWDRCLAAGADLMVAEHKCPDDAAGFARRSYVALQRLAQNGNAARPAPPQGRAATS